MSQRCFSLIILQKKRFGICIRIEIDCTRNRYCFVYFVFLFGQIYRDGATPIKFGIKPLNNPGNPSYLIICL